MDKIISFGRKFQIWQAARFGAERAETTGTIRMFKPELGTPTAAAKPYGARS